MFHLLWNTNAALYIFYYSNLGSSCHLRDNQNALHSSPFSNERILQQDDCTITLEFFLGFAIMSDFLAKGFERATICLILLKEDRLPHRNFHLSE